MKKALCLTILLLTVISMAVAQSPAMFKKGDNTIEVESNLCSKGNTLNVEIVSNNGDHFNHPNHPGNGEVMCPTVIWFQTNEQYAWYQWETSLPSSNTWNTNTLAVHLDYSGFVQVTVGDENGNVGSDIIWFSVMNDNVNPMEGFIMEINDDLHAVFKGTATEEHHRLLLSKGYDPGQFIYGDYFNLSPGNWSFIDTTVSYSSDSLWVYNVRVFNQCGSSSSSTIPGILLGTEERRLTIKSLLQDENAPMVYSTYHFVYIIFTVDEYGNRHEFMNINGNPIILQPETTSWNLLAPHADPYYQVGVGRLLEDGSYQLLSLSNRVPNPWPDADGINEENDDSSFSVFPNPSHGLVTVIGKGTLSVVNMLGQIVLRQEIDGESTVELPRGIYFVKLGGAVRKIVVE